MMWCVGSCGCSVFNVVFRLIRVLFSRFSFGGGCRLYCVLWVVRLSSKVFLVKVLFVCCVVQWLIRLCMVWWQFWWLYLGRCWFIVLYRFVIVLLLFWIVCSMICSSVRCDECDRQVIMLVLIIVRWLFLFSSILFGCGLVCMWLWVNIWLRQVCSSELLSILLCFVLIVLVLILLLWIRFIVSICCVQKLWCGSGIIRLGYGLNIFVSVFRFLVLVMKFSFLFSVLQEVVIQLCMFSCCVVLVCFLVKCVIVVSSFMFEVIWVLMLGCCIFIVIGVLLGNFVVCIWVSELVVIGVGLKWWNRVFIGVFSFCVIIFLILIVVILFMLFCMCCSVDR